MHISFDQAGIKTAPFQIDYQCWIGLAIYRLRILLRRSFHEVNGAPCLIYVLQSVTFFKSLAIILDSTKLQRWSIYVFIVVNFICCSKVENTIFMHIKHQLNSNYLSYRDEDVEEVLRTAECLERNNCWANSKFTNVHTYIYVCICIRIYLSTFTWRKKSLLLWIVKLVCKSWSNACTQRFISLSWKWLS